MYPVGEQWQNVTASVGVAGLDDKPRISFATLIRQAQRALEAAREQGGDRIVADG
jgi:GGDEF domain-containing protein